MKFKILSLILPCLLLCACGSTTANLSTTAGSTDSFVDNSTGLSGAESITASNVPADEAIGNIVGNEVTLTLPAIATSSALATFKQTPASFLATSKTLIGKDLAYAESVAVQLQKFNTGLASFVGSTTSILNAAGLAPASSSQANILAKITSALGKSGTAIATVNQILSPSNLATLTNS